MLLQPGTRLGRYDVISPLGAGGMGEVYRTRDERLQREVVLKVLPAGTLATDEQRQRFRKEALALSRLNHTNIEIIYDFDTQEGLDFLVMEYIPGETLRRRLAGAPLPEEEVVRLGAQLLEGLRSAHGHGVIHRDLKPENLMVAPEGHLKILDFGLAKLLRPDSETAATRTESITDGVLGTPPYMAPEQLRGEELDARTDLFAAGAVLYEMATGRRPFPQERGPLLIDAILRQAPPAPRSINPSISPGLESLIMQALEKEPARRFQSAAAFHGDLESLTRLGGSAVRRRPLLTRRSLWIGTAAAGAAAIAAAGIYSLFVAPRAIDSLAVLPFVNENADPDAEYLSDGIAETIINNVSQIPEVKVIARSSVFHYKGRPIDLRDVARELNVRAVLAGRLQRRGEALVISVELIDTLNNRHLWGQRYSRGFSDIFLVEEDIARRVTENLRLRLSGEEKGRLARHHTVSTRAYELYLKGRHSMPGYSHAGLKQALRYFEEALEVDPEYALPHLGIAESYYWLSTAFLSPHEAMPRARDAARKALQLDEDLGEAHAVLAMIASLYEWDWEGAERAHLQALSLNPGYAAAHFWYGLHLTNMARAREALVEMKKAVELDPLSSNYAWYALWPYVYAPAGERRYNLAVEGSRMILDDDPNFYPAHFLIALAYQQTDRRFEALVELRRAVDIAGEKTGGILGLLGHGYSIAGEKEKAAEILKTLTDPRRQAFTPAFGMALLHIGLEDRDAAFAWLERAYDRREEEMPLLKVDPRLDALREDPRFQDLLRRMRLGS